MSNLWRSFFGFTDDEDSNETYEHAVQRAKHLVEEENYEDKLAAYCVMPSVISTLKQCICWHGAIGKDRAWWKMPERLSDCGRNRQAWALRRRQNVVRR